MAVLLTPEHTDTAKIVNAYSYKFVRVQGVATHTVHAQRTVRAVHLATANALYEGAPRGIVACPAAKDPMHMQRSAPGSSRPRASSRKEIPEQLEDAVRTEQNLQLYTLPDPANAGGEHSAAAGSILHQRALAEAQVVACGGGGEPICTGAQLDGTGSRFSLWQTLCNVTEQRCAKF